MELYFRKLGSGDPLVILHGLYGSSDNWYSIGRALAHDNEVYLVDQRNHGHSLHHPEHNYGVMCSDLTEFFNRHNLNATIILGHSMGGKTALAFGLQYPEKVKKMIVVDISPFGYDQSHSQESTAHHRIIQGLLTIHPETLISRAEADTILQKSIAPSSIRQFLLKNLKRDGRGKFFWAMNIPAIAANMTDIFEGVIPHNTCNTTDIPQFPLLFIRGEYSGYIKNRDEAAIRQCFPWSQLVMVKGSGHWLHAEQPQTFLHIVKDFLRSTQQ